MDAEEDKTDQGNDLLDEDVWEEDQDDELCTPRTSERRRLRRMGSHRRTRTSTLSLDSNASSNDASSMIADVLQSKNKTLTSQLAAERKRRKKTEEGIHSL